MTDPQAPRMKRHSDTCTRCDRDRCEVANQLWCRERVEHDFQPKMARW
jgi:hypothetical protein